MGQPIYLNFYLFLFGLSRPILNTMSAFIANALID